MMNFKKKFTLRHLSLKCPRSHLNKQAIQARDVRRKVKGLYQGVRNQLWWHIIAKA